MSNDILIQQCRASGYNLLNPYFQDKNINSMFGLDETSTNKNLWNWLGKYNQYWWKKTALPTIEYKEKRSIITGTGANFQPNSTYQYSTSISVNSETGELSLDNASSITLGAFTPRATWNQQVNNLKNLVPFYINVSSTGSLFFYVENTSLISSYYDSDNSMGSIYLYGQRPNVAPYLYQISSELVEISSTETSSYVFSPIKTTYPENGDLNGYHYQLLGIPFQNWLYGAQSAIGNYTGTGDLNVSLTFDFVPQIVVVMNNTYNYVTGGGQGFIWVGQPGNTSSGDWKSFTLSEKTLSWNSSNNQYNCNRSGIVYYYFAFGN